MKNKIIFLVALFSFALPWASAQNLAAQDARIQDARIKESNRLKPFDITNPNILILSSNLGGGHTSASNAARDAILGANSKANIVIKNADDFSTNLQDSLQMNIYLQSIQHCPGIANMAYNHMMKQASHSLEYLTSQIKIDDLVEYIEENHFTHIICTFSCPAAALAIAKSNGKLQRQKISFIVTDMVVEAFPLIAKSLDMTFLPHNTLVNGYLNMGVSESQLAVTGMPISDKVKDPINRKDFLLQHQLDPNIYTITLAGGGEGIGNFPLIIQSIAKSFNHEPVQIIVVCGRNEQHSIDLRKIIKRYKSQGVTLHVLFHKSYDEATSSYKVSLTPQADLFGFIKSSDLYITKSGGLAPCEAAAIGVPMILLDIFGAQEARNAKFYKEQNIGLVTENQAQVGQLVLEIKKSQALRDKMLYHQNAFANTLNFNPIIDFVYKQ